MQEEGRACVRENGTEGDDLVAQLAKSRPVVQETPVQPLGRKIPWRRDRLPTPVFLSFPCGSAGKESSCDAGDAGSVPG